MPANPVRPARVARSRIGSKHTASPMKTACLAARAERESWLCRSSRFTDAAGSGATGPKVEHDPPRAPHAFTPGTVLHSGPRPEPLGTPPENDTAAQRPLPVDARGKPLHNNRVILPPKPKAVAQRHVHLRRPRLIRHIV